MPSPSSKADTWVLLVNTCGPQRKPQGRNSRVANASAASHTASPLLVLRGGHCWPLPLRLTVKAGVDLDLALGGWRSCPNPLSADGAAPRFSP